MYFVPVVNPVPNSVASPISNWVTLGLQPLFDACNNYLSSFVAHSPCSVAAIAQEVSADLSSTSNFHVDTVDTVEKEKDFRLFSQENDSSPSYSSSLFSFDADGISSNEDEDWKEIEGDDEDEDPKETNIHNTFRLCSVLTLPITTSKSSNSTVTGSFFSPERILVENLRKETNKVRRHRHKQAKPVEYHRASLTPLTSSLRSPPQPRQIPISQSSLLYTNLRDLISPRPKIVGLTDEQHDEKQAKRGGELAKYRVLMQNLPSATVITSDSTPPPVFTSNLMRRQRQSKKNSDSSPSTDTEHSGGTHSSENEESRRAKSAVRRDMPDAIMKFGFDKDTDELQSLLKVRQLQASPIPPQTAPLARSVTFSNANLSQSIREVFMKNFGPPPTTAISANNVRESIVPTETINSVISSSENNSRPSTSCLNKKQPNVVVPFSRPRSVSRQSMRSTPTTPTTSGTNKTEQSVRGSGYSSNVGKSTTFSSVSTALPSPYQGSFRRFRTRGCGSEQGMEHIFAT